MYEVIVTAAIIAALGTVVAVVTYVAARRDPATPFDDLRAQTVVVQTASGRTVRGVAVAVGADAIVLAGASELSESGDVDLGDTTVVVPRASIVYVQSGPDVVRDAALRGV